MFYILAMILLILCCVCVLIAMKRFVNKEVTNAIFVLSIFACYGALVWNIYSKVGLNDWNFRNALPTANVSPFMFFTLPLGLILPKKARGYYRTLVSLLCVGMFFAPVLSCIYFASIGYRFHPSFLLDYYSHFALFLWGIYLVRSGQVSLRKKDALIGGSIIVGAALLMLIANVIFDTAFFGLSLNGKHNIYNHVLVSNSLLSAVLYFIGLIAVLFVGFLFRKVWEKRRIGCADLGQLSPA